MTWVSCLMVAPSVGFAVARRPFVAYRALAAERPTLADALRGPLVWLLFMACVVSWTTSGALLVEHLLLSPLAWWFVPVVQGSWVVLVARRFGERSIPRTIALYYHGHLPWFVWLATVAGICLMAPDPWSWLRWLLETGVLPAMLVVAAGWCGVLTFAMFRCGLGLTRRQSVLATVAHYVGCTTIIVGWFAVTGQLLPLWGIM